MRIIFLAIVLTILTFLSGCETETVKPAEAETLFYKNIDTTIFKGDIYVSITTHQDTINNNGSVSFVDLPTVNVHVVNGRMALNSQGYIFVSEDNLTFSQTIYGFASGIFQFAEPHIIFSHDINDQTQQVIYIKLATLNNGSHFVLGVNLK